MGRVWAVGEDVQECEEVGWLGMGMIFLALEDWRLIVSVSFFIFISVAKIWMGMDGCGNW